MSNRLTRLTAGTALAVALTVGGAVPAFATTTDPPPASDPAPAPPATDPAPEREAEATSDPLPSTNPVPAPAPAPATDPGPGPGVTSGGSLGTDPGAGSQRRPVVTAPSQRQGQVGTIPQRAGTSNTQQAVLAETGDDVRRNVIGGLVAMFLVSSGLAATFWSRSGVQLRRGAKNTAV